MRSFSTKEAESKSQWKLCFKLYCLLDADSISVDSIEYLFLFEQVMRQSTTSQKGGRVEILGHCSADSEILLIVLQCAI